MSIRAGTDIMSGERQPGKVSRSGRPAVCERLHAVLGTPERLSVYTPYWGLQRGRVSTRHAGDSRETERLHAVLGTPERLSVYIPCWGLQREAEM